MSEAEEFFGKAMLAAYLSGNLDLLNETIKLYNMFRFNGYMYLLDV